MAAYPDIILDSQYPITPTVLSRVPLRVSLETRTLISAFEGEGEEKRRLKWTVPRRVISFDYAFMTQSEIRTIWQFWLARRGAWEAFTFFIPNLDIYAYEYVGTADGGETNLRLPSRSAGAYTLYRNGSPDSGWSMTLRGGPDGEDLAQLHSAASAGDRFEFSFTGRLGVQCRFRTDQWEMELIKAQGSGTITLQGLVHDMTSY